MKTAIITGSTSGIGAETARRLACDGYNIAINARSETDVQKGQCIADECEKLGEKYGIKAKVFIADVSSFEECEKMTKDVHSEFKSIDALVNNAGITRDGLLARMKEDAYDTVIAVNQKSVYNMMHCVSAIMMKQRSGKIVNVSSVAGVHGNAGQFNYSASKAAIIGMTKSAAKELGARNITVNAVAPGFIETPMTDALTDSQKEAIIKQITLGRYGKPSEVASVISFLLSSDADYVTGQVIEISGGIII
jgi:3-oxoacyl-[acyl-carrier protein] reductase